MGRMYRFDCPRCGFVAKIAAGRNSNDGFTTETVLCKDCKEFYDVVCEVEIDPLELRLSSRLGHWAGIELSADQLSLIEDKLALPSSMLPNSRKLVLHPVKRAGFQRFPGQRNFQIKLSCPLNHDHRIEKWKAPARCPKCADYLEGSLLPFRAWD